MKISGADGKEYDVREHAADLGRWDVRLDEREVASFGVEPGTDEISSVCRSVRLISDEALLDVAAKYLRARRDLSNLLRDFKEDIRALAKKPPNPDASKRLLSLFERCLGAVLPAVAEDGNSLGSIAGASGKKVFPLFDGGPGGLHLYAAVEGSDAAGTAWKLHAYNPPSGPLISIAIAEVYRRLDPADLVGLLRSTANELRATARTDEARVLEDALTWAASELGGN